MASHGEIAAARNAAFSTLVFAELLCAFGARSETKLFHEVGLFSNLRLFAIVTVRFGLQLWIHHTPILERLFGVQPISIRQCLAWSAIGAIPLLVLEVRKLARRASRALGPDCEDPASRAAPC